MIAAALVFSIGFTVCAIIAVVRHNSSFSYSPNYIEGSKAFPQIVRIAVISPWAFIGFENISHFSEEYTFKTKKVRSILIASVLITTALYILVSLLSISAYPSEYSSWIEYIRDMGNLSGIKAVPAFYAASHYLGNTGVTILMLALLGVIITSLIGNMLAISRLLYAAGREGEAPKAFKKLSKNGIPTNAILAVVIVSAFIPFLGRTAIGWIVDVTTLGATLIYSMISHAVYKHAKETNSKLEKNTGIIGLIMMGIFLLLLLIPGLLPFHAMETESYVLFIIWAVAGIIYFHFLVKKETKKNYSQQRIVVWVILLVMILFASMMWVSRATEQAADASVHKIYEYHQRHPNHDSAEASVEERTEFLQEQADEITKTNTLYTIVSLFLFIISMTIMLTNYKETKALGEKLSAAEEEAEAAKRIAELKASFTAMLDNMPGMSFSKDAKTRVYIACNQAFAEYANKKTPEEVVGLTDMDIFDAETARHFTEDDSMALSMDKPYVFYEDVQNGAGEPRHFQTTKLRYTDDRGRECILGMCEDITEKIAMQRENESTKEAYEKSISTGLIYTRIAQTLAKGYKELFYVNLETEEFIEYVTDEKSGMLSEAKRGWHFFAEYMIEQEFNLYPADKEAFEKAMNKKTLVDILSRNKSVITTYRVLSNDKPTYVTMKVSRMEDSEKFIIIGITDVDEQMKQQKLADRIKEERIAYNRINALIGDFLCAYVVIPETGVFREFSSTKGYEEFSVAKSGDDFFKSTRENAKKHVYHEDIDRFLLMFTKKGVFSEIERSGIFSLTYRLVIDGKPTHVQLKAAMVEEKEGQRLVVGVNNIDLHVRQEEEYARRLETAQFKANFDALTGVRNRYAYLDAEEHLDLQIEEELYPEFAITIFDVNDLKTINDKEGHKSGDKYLCDACKIICNIFKHSAVFRVGGDEFAVISKDEDYYNIDSLLETVAHHNEEAVKNDGIVIACGMAKYENDPCVAPVFERADQNMYDNKNFLKYGE